VFALIMFQLSNKGFVVFQ